MNDKQRLWRINGTAIAQLMEVEIEVDTEEEAHQIYVSEYAEVEMLERFELDIDEVT